MNNNQVFSDNSSQLLVLNSTFLMFGIIAGRVMGYFRDFLVTYFYGKSFQSDAYMVALTFPLLLYAMLTGGVVTSSFVPVLSREKGENFNILSNTLFLGLLIIGSLLGFLSIIFAPYLSLLLAPFMSIEGRELTISLLRVASLGIVPLLGAGGFMATLHCKGDFRTPSLTGLIFNGVIVLVILIGTTYLGIFSTSWGLVIGSILNWLFLGLSLYFLEHNYKSGVNFEHPGIKKVIVLSIPVLIGLAIYQVNPIIEKAIASNIGEGAITIVGVASRIIQLPYALFGLAISTVLLPTLSKSAANYDYSNLKKNLSWGFSATSFFLIPSAVGIFILSYPIVRLLFEWGEFSKEAAVSTAFVLRVYCLGVWAHGVNSIFIRAYYSLQEPKIPTFLGAFTILIQAIMYYFFSKLWGVSGLALGSSIGAFILLSLLIIFLRPRLKGIGLSLSIKELLKTTVSSLVMGLTIYITSLFLLNRFSEFTLKIRFFEVFINISIAVLVYLLVNYLLKSEVLNQYLKIILRKKIEEV